LSPGRLVGLLIIAAVASSLVSVAASGIFLGLGLLAWLGDCWKQRGLVLSPPPFTWLLVLFVFLTALSAAFSAEPLHDLRHLKASIKFMIPLLLATYLTVSLARKALFWIFGIAGLSMLAGFVQFLFSEGINLLDRIDGFMSHWMTYSGQLMMVLLACAAFGIVQLKSQGGGGRIKSLPWFFLAALMGGILVLTYTRSAWGGALGGLALLTVLNLRLRWTLVLGTAAVLVFLAMPASVHERLVSGFDLRDTTTRGRIDIWRSGLLVAMENPLTGVGYSSVAEESLKYRRERDLPDWAYQHSHNNLIQIAATSGFPALAVWIAMWLKIAWDFFRIRRDRKGDVFVSVMTAGSISVLAAFHLMGLLEYNFGDSEVVTLLLFFVALPYVLDRGRDHRETGSGMVRKES